MNDDARDAVATVAALGAARETGVLDALLESADTPREVAAHASVDERTASVLVDVLADRGLFERVGDAYEPTNRALGLLTKTDLRSIGRLPHETDRFECYGALPDAIASDDPVAAARDSRPDDFERNRLGYEQTTPDATVNAAVSAAIRAAPDAGSVLDVGGAPGRYATEFAARGHAVTLRDDPGAVDAARPLLAPRDVALDPGPLAADLPTADLAFASDLAPRLDDDALDAFATAAHDALTREATDGSTTRPPVADRALVLVEHVRERSPRTPTRRLDALATGQTGDHRTGDTLREALQTAGFETVEIRAVPGIDRHAVVATPRRT
ncbi:class I SAM-dependent methyltransferase [Halorubellus sp. JP-L1]|uniref:class I SAM-dependent methyltransferase n=1 Tax=Halorubellus sp. JP-L1 TaxID=2715753 RepID=UPI001409628C|nr:class I SAM-dependent methyltransferase [Halorubellus sp. JP-L1]NHN41575.1 class I SAM-dependent methyltransferase [Halorubellus sp. JP-L1]